MSTDAKRRGLSTLLLAFAMLHTAVSSAETPEAAPLVRIGSDSYTLDEFLAHLKVLKPTIDFFALPPQQQEHWIDDFVERKLFARLGREAGLDADRETRARIELFTDGVLADAEKDRLVAAIDVSDAELENYYASHREEFEIPPRLMVEHVIYRYQDSAENARERLVNGAEFDDLAGEAEPNLIYSRRGWLTPNLLIVELRDAVLDLKPGQTTAVLESGYGFHVVRLNELEPARYRSFAEARADVAEKIRRAKAANVLKSALADAEREFGVEILIDPAQRGASSSPAEALPPAE